MSTSTVTMPRWLVAVIALVLSTGVVAGGALWLTGRKLAVIDICAGPSCPPVAELILCCNHITGDCVEVTSLSECHPEFEYATVCTWGRTLESGGIECYD